MKLAEKMKEVGRHRLYPVMVARYSDSGSASDLSATRLLIVLGKAKDAIRVCNRCL